MFVFLLWVSKFTHFWIPIPMGHEKLGDFLDGRFQQCKKKRLVFFHETKGKRSCKLLFSSRVINSEIIIEIECIWPPFYNLVKDVCSKRFLCFFHIIVIVFRSGFLCHFQFLMWFFVFWFFFTKRFGKRESVSTFKVKVMFLL